jgi:hypothetical protein
LIRYGPSGRIEGRCDRGRWRFRRQEEVLTVLGPYAKTGLECRGIIRRDRPTAREFNDKWIRFAPSQRREDSRIFAAAALDHGNRSGERNRDYGRDPQKLLRGE